MLKKLMSFLFEEEEEEVYADGELEEAIFKDVPKKNIDPEPVVSQPRQEPRSYARQQAVATPQVPPVPQPTISKEEPRKFTSIEIEPKKEVTAGTQQATRRKPISVDAPIRAEKQKSDFNLAPIISPIFGSNDENNSSPLEAKVPAIGGTKQKKAMDVISPMYGIATPEEPTAKSTKTVEGKRHAAAPKVEIEETKEEQELPDLPLEAMIKKDEDVEDDTMQISLFGEDAPVHKATDSDYKIEE